MGRGNLKGFGGSYRYSRRRLLRSAAFLLRRRNRSLPYPLAWGYSDFVVVPTAALETFCRLCGVFAAMNLFVEVALPTALALACDRIVVEADTQWRGVEIWDPAEVEDLRTRHGGDLARLLAAYEPHQLYLHPVKLSGWKA